MTGLEATPRLCANPNCGREIPDTNGKGRPRIYCGESACTTERAAQRQQARRGEAQACELGGAPKVIEPGDPGTPEWCAFEGFTPADLKRHSAWRYWPADEEKIVERLRDAKPNAKGKRPHVPTIRRVVRDSTGGLVFPKFPAAEINPEPIPDQLDPDIAVATDPRWKLHKHDRVIPGQFKRLALVKRDDKLTTIPVQWVKRGERVYGLEHSLELCELHINRSRGGDYNSETGKGDHRGTNIIGWHRHAPRTAKYFNVGDNKRTDFGPSGLEPWRTAREGMAHLEGKKKHMACEAAGWATISWLSISMSSKREVEAHADWLKAHNPSIVQFVGCDADWTDFERNRGAVFRQAMYVQTWYRERGIEAYMIAPPVDRDWKCSCDPKDLLARNLPFERMGRLGSDPDAPKGWLCFHCHGYFKGHDEWYGAGGTTGDLRVHDRQPPYDVIADFVLSLPIDRSTKPGRARALRGLSLHGWNQALSVNLLDVPLKTLQKIMCARRPQDVPLILEDIRGALEIDGLLDIEKREYLDDELRTGVAWDWVKRPSIHVKREFEPLERLVSHRDFLRERNMNVTVAAEVIERIDRFENNIHERLDRIELRQLDREAERTSGDTESLLSDDG